MKTRLHHKNAAVNSVTFPEPFPARTFVVNNGLVVNPRFLSEYEFIVEDKKTKKNKHGVA